ncbi:MAG: selenide, water dikinase SelD [Halothiobacillaceae bacterium]
MKEPIKLTEYSHGAGCGCKIAPALLDEMLRTALPPLEHDRRLWVGNDSRDDAAVYDLDDGTGIISTTDFFMPIVDDPFTFGRIAATNALSDIYAMGGSPLVAIAILGWPIDRLGPEIAAEVIDGGRQACRDAGIVIAGGHSIDAPEPIFGLAVTGRVTRERLRRNDTARAGAQLFLTKPLGIGILTTAQKSKILAPEHAGVAAQWMCRLNRVGTRLSALPQVQAMTDVTGFGLAGHLLEMCAGSGLRAAVDLDAVPVLPAVEEYLARGAVPGGTERNHASYGHRMAAVDAREKALLCDPQTSGGLLVAVAPEGAEAVAALLREEGLHDRPIGQMRPADAPGAELEIVR